MGGSHGTEPSPHPDRPDADGWRFAEGSTGLDPEEPGLTILELMVVVAIIVTLAAIAAPLYARARDKAMVVRAIAEISTIQKEVSVYAIDRDGGLPESLADMSWSHADPWGRPYEYLSFTGVQGKGGMRKDRFLVPLNSDYDLYSKGKDGLSTAPLTAKNSRDDIIRANNGTFIGLASDF